MAWSDGLLTGHPGAQLLLVPDTNMSLGRASGRRTVLWYSKEHRSFSVSNIRVCDAAGETKCIEMSTEKKKKSLRQHSSSEGEGGRSVRLVYCWEHTTSMSTGGGLWFSLGGSWCLRDRSHCLWEVSTRKGHHDTETVFGQVFTVRGKNNQNETRMSLLAHRVSYEWNISNELSFWGFLKEKTGSEVEDIKEK